MINAIELVRETCTEAELDMRIGKYKILKILSRWKFMEIKNKGFPFVRRYAVSGRQGQEGRTTQFHGRENFIVNFSENMCIKLLSGSF